MLEFSYQSEMFTVISPEELHTSTKFGLRFLTDVAQRPKYCSICAKLTQVMKVRLTDPNSDHKLGSAPGKIRELVKVVKTLTTLPVFNRVRRNGFYITGIVFHFFEDNFNGFIKLCIFT